MTPTGRANNESLIYLFKHLGFELVELDDWNCCGSSSAHSVNGDIAFDLASRNLSLAPPGRPLLVACPSYLLRLRHAYLKLKTDPSAREHYEKTWGRAFDKILKLYIFLKSWID